MGRLIDDRTGLDLITPDECLELLATTDVGRLAIGQGGSVDIFPINYALDGRAILFRTADGTKWRDGPGADVAFEVDELDAEHRTGWSVVVHGRLEPLTPEMEGEVSPMPWAAGAKPHVLRLVPHTIAGRRIT
jgi:nitroimidazol reductase NimA-like FMN-containing flavoprotein (pyridoxamine 5'-phosphate oxidase superfamily)